jgi:hypothetical protein
MTGKTVFLQVEYVLGKDKPDEELSHVLGYWLPG